MKRPIYSVRDVYTGFSAPFVDVNDLAAKRNFAFAVNNNHDTMGFAPKDYDLYKLGEFDHETGKFEILPIPELVVSAVNVYNEK